MIIVAFGPAVVIPRNLCYDVKHYACKGDPVPKGEIAYALMTGGIKKAQEIAELHEESIIWVDPHPDTKSPHDFENPTFDETKKKIVRDYLPKIENQ